MLSQLTAAPVHAPPARVHPSGRVCGDVHAPQHETLHGIGGGGHHLDAG